MAKLTFPGVGAPYRGFIGEVRGWLNRIASFAENSPGSVTALNAQLAVLATKLGYVHPAAANQKLITTAVKFSGPAITGSYVDGYTFTIVDGVITAITAS